MLKPAPGQVGNPKVRSELLDIVDVGVGFYGNYASLKLQDGKWEFGQEYEEKIAVSLVFMGIEYSNCGYMPDGGEMVVERVRGLYADEYFTFFSAAAYPLFLGGSIEIAFDYMQFLQDMKELRSK